GQRLPYGGQQCIVAGEFPAFEHGIHRTGVPQGVVSGYLSAEAGEVAVDELPVLLYLGGQEIRAAVYQLVDLIGLQVRYLAAPGIERGRVTPMRIHFARAR